MNTLPTNHSQPRKIGSCHPDGTPFSFIALSACADSYRPGYCRSHCNNHFQNNSPNCFLFFFHCTTVFFRCFYYVLRWPTVLSANLLLFQRPADYPEAFRYSGILRTIRRLVDVQEFQRLSGNWQRFGNPKNRRETGEDSRIPKIVGRLVDVRESQGSSGDWQRFEIPENYPETYEDSESLRFFP